MTTEYKDNFYEELDKDHFVWYLPSSNFYSTLVLKKPEPSSSYKYCIDIPQGNLAEKCNLHSICVNIENILSQFDYEPCKKILGNYRKCCEYLSYFIYSYIKSSYPCEDLDKLYTQLSKSKNVKFPADSSCIIKNFAINKEDFEKKKELYLHGEILYWIKERDILKEFNEKIPFVEYFNKCSKIYTDIVQNYYCKKKDEIFKTDLVDFQENFNAARDYLRSNRINISTKKLEAPGSINCALYNQVGEEADMAARVLSRDVKDDRSIGQGDMDTFSDDTNLNTKGIIRISTGITGGMSLLLFSLYKFTPFRYWLRRGSLRKKINQYNAEDKNHELFLNHSGYEHSNPNEIAYNIGYSS